MRAVQRSVASWWPLLLLASAVTTVVTVLGQPLTDLEVYRLGGETARGSGAHLYDVQEPRTGLPFTYPPIAAVLMVPWAPVPMPVAVAGWTALSVAALAVAVRVCLRAAGTDAAPWQVTALAAGTLALEPVWSTLAFGQVNLLLLALVLLDLLVVRGRANGSLTGIAAAVKLTPLLFVVLLLLTGRRRAAATATAAFVACHVLGWLLLPSATTAYAGGVAVDADRVGGVAYALNQSVLGVLTRVCGGDPGPLAWLALAGSLATAILWWAVRLWPAEPVLATGVAGMAMLLASPISWSHHWVWCIPVACGVWHRSRAAACAWVAVFTSACLLLVPARDDRELTWAWWQHLPGNAYAWSALLLTAWLALAPPAQRAGRMHPVTSPS